LNTPSNNTIKLIASISVAIIVIFASVKYLHWWDGGQRTKYARIGTCDALHESITNPRYEFQGDFVLGGSVIHAVSMSDDPITDWMMAFIAENNLKHADDFIVLSGPEYMFKVESVKGALERSLQKDDIHSPKANRLQSDAILLNCINKSDIRP